MKSHFTNDDFDFINRLFAAKKGIKFTVDEPKEKIREVESVMLEAPCS